MVLLSYPILATCPAYPEKSSPSEPGAPGSRVQVERRGLGLLLSEPKTTQRTTQGFLKKRIGGYYIRPYRGTSSIRNRLPVGPYSRAMPRALRKSWGGGVFL